jgi:hypothetical protein
MSETTDAMLADIDKEIGVDEDKLSKLAKLAQEQFGIQTEIEQLEEAVKARKADLQKIKTETIPDFMDEIGIEEFTTRGGGKVKVKPFYQASIPKDRKDEAFRWLTEHGFDDIIKVSVNFAFGKSQYAEAVELCRMLDELGYSTVPVLNVHPMTLKGWVRSMSEDGEEFPQDLFGAFIGRVAEIKL